MTHPWGLTAAIQAADTLAIGNLSPVPGQCNDVHIQKLNCLYPDLLRWRLTIA